MKPGLGVRRTALIPAFALTVVVAACGGGGTDDGPSEAPAAPGMSTATGVPGDLVTAPASSPAAPMPVPETATGPARGTAPLKPPALTFNDTGFSVSDGVTFNGRWWVDSEVGWEYSLDRGVTWIPGTGDQFEVVGDGAKTIWVRARDESGTVSEIVMVNCVLDTTAPDAPVANPSTEGTTRVLQVSGVEPGARWEYAVDERQTWLPGTGPGLAVLGNGLAAVWLRQVDLAGNASPPQTIALDASSNDAWHEASGDPLQPSTLSVGDALTLLVHGSVVRGDADYVRWDVPAGHRIASVRLVRYVSDDAIAFYALQRAPVFDAGVDVSRMLSYGHMGPDDLMRNVLAGVESGALGAGPTTLWFQQTGPLATEYAIELVLQPSQ